MRVTRKMMNSNSVYNINANKEHMDKLNTQMATQKKFTDPSDDPITAIRAIRYRTDLSEVSQYLDRNVSDAVSWTENTQTAIDSARELMRSLKAEYTSASNGTNESKDQRIYYDNMENLVKEFYSIGNTSTEDRYIFTGYRTTDSLTFTEKDFAERESAVANGKFSYVRITETFKMEDIENYTYTKNIDSYTSPGVTDDDISSLNDTVNETKVQNIQVYRLRLSYKELDAGISHSLSGINFTPVSSDYEIPVPLEDGKIYFNKDKGTLIFGEGTRNTLVGMMGTDGISVGYNKSSWKVGDVKPEYYFDCIDIGLGTGKAITYNDHQQTMNYHMGDSQNIKVNTNACDVFTLDARRDLDELHDALNLLDEARDKVGRLQGMQEDTIRYGDADREKIDYLLAAAEKERNYAQQKVDDLLSHGITKAEKYFDMVNKAATEMGTSIKRLELIRNRLTADKTTVATQTSNNENIDLSTLAVDSSEASLSYSAALQVTGKIGQQTLINFI